MVRDIDLEDIIEVAFYDSRLHLHGTPKSRLALPAFESFKAGR
jgi:hypothetical protein